MFARCGFGVSVHYGANQPEYDLLVSRDDAVIRVSVKGSQDGSWGLAPSHMSRDTKADYHSTIDRRLTRHRPGTVMCFVQFKGVMLEHDPRGVKERSLRLAI